MYFLFVGFNYYPDRAVENYVGSFDTIELALKNVKNYSSHDWYQIATVCDKQLEIVSDGNIQGGTGIDNLGDVL